MLYEYEGRDLGDVSISQGTLKVARKPTEARRETQNRFFLIILRRSNVANNLILEV